MVLKEQAAGMPFDNGVFELVEEPFHAPLPEEDSLSFTADKIQWNESWQEDDSSVLVVHS